jgi:AsmA family protein
VLDLRPFITHEPVPKNEAPRDFADIYRELDQATFSLSDLNDADVQLTLQVGRWISLPGAVHDAMLRVNLEHGHLTLPMHATVAGVALSGAASADASVVPARFELSLGARNSDVGDLAEVFAGVPGVRGSLGRFNLHLAAQGDRGSDLMKSLDLRLDLDRGRMSYGNAAGAHPVHFSLDDLRLVVPAGRPLKCDAHGLLIDATFDAHLRSASLVELMQSAQAPIDFELKAGSARAEVHATLRPATHDSESEATFQLMAPHSKEIAGWLGLKPGADAPLRVQGSLHTDSQRWHLGELILQVGHSALSADLRRTVESGKPLLTLQLAADLIDAQELQGLLPEQAARSPSAAPAAADMINIPILPVGISLADADIVVRIKRISSTPLLTVRDLRFDGHVRDGMMNASPFSASVADVDFTGAILLDLRTEQPHAAVWLAAPRLDVGRMLKTLGIARTIDAEIGAVSLQLDLHSSHLGQVLAQSELTADFDGGHLTLQDANSGGTMRVSVSHGALKAAPGGAIQLDLQGSLDEVPVSIGIRTAKAADLLDPNRPVPFVFAAQVAESSLTLSGEVQRPFSNREVEFTLDLQGHRLDTLNALARASLPPWGPWSASGKFRISRSGYEMPSLRVQVGSSQLTGNGKMETTVLPPRIDVALAAPTIQLDDFRFGNWSPETSNPDTGRTKTSLSDIEEAATRKSDRVQQLLSPAVLKRQNAKVTVDVEQVASGRDELGSGRLEATLEDGHVVIGPAVVNAPGGSATFRLGYKPRDASVGASLRVGIQHFDYGILARRIDPKSEMHGLLNLDLDVKSHAPSISELLRHGNGHINFEVWPENMTSGLLDFWAVNVLTALLPAIDSSSAPRVNCAIGHFALTDGKLADKVFLIDTTRMRINGQARADFKSEDISLYARPRSKTPQLLTFPLPVEVSGKFTDFHVGFRALDVLQTAAQFATSAIWVPIEMMFGKETPSDGHDVCSFPAK